MIKKKFTLYCYEALGLGIFMFSAGFFDAIIDHPDLPIRQHIHAAVIRRFLIGLSMGATALLIFNSVFGKRSGAYINPAVTLVQYRLGHISASNAFFYSVFQFAGGSLGMWAVCLVIPKWMQHPAINYIVTVPGQGGVWLAFLLEFIISFLLISVVLFSSAHKKLAKYTSLFVAILITVYITIEAPYSGMSMNPARTFASAVVANQWNSFWLYCTAPVLGMLLGGWCFKRFKARGH